MICEAILSRIISNFGPEYSIRPAKDGCILNTPFLDPSNDPIEIYIQFDHEMVILSDMGKTLDYLFLKGIDLKPNSKQKWYFDSIFKRLNVKLLEENIYVKVKVEDISRGINLLVNALSSINCLIYTGKITKPIAFYDQVSSWLDLNRISSAKKQEFVGASGKPIIVDFVIHRSNKMPIFLYPLHSLSVTYAKALSYKTLYYWSELREASHEFKAACILDDNVEDDVWSEMYPALKRKSDIIGFWSEDQQYLAESFA